MPTSNPSVMASGTVSTINTLARSAFSPAQPEYLNYVALDYSKPRSFLVCFKPVLCIFIEQITQDDIRKTYGGSSGSRGYYSSAFARLVLADRFGLGSIRTMVFSFWSFFLPLHLL